MHANDIDQHIDGLLVHLDHLQVRMDDLHKELNVLWRSALTDQLIDQHQWVLDRANILGAMQDIRQEQADVQIELDKAMDLYLAVAFPTPQ